MALNRKFLQDVEELIDIAHRASSDEAAKATKPSNNSTSSGPDHGNSAETSKKPKSRLSKIQKAFILAEILPRKY